MVAVCPVAGLHEMPGVPAGDGARQARLTDVLVLAAGTVFATTIR
jgi:hypothetical protein